MNNDLISREALKKAACVKFYTTPYYKHILDLIDNAPTVPLPDFKEGYKQAIRDGKTNFQRSQGEWIPVSERLPDKEGKYLVSTDYCDVCMDSYRDGWFVLNLGNVVAWQALPEPYKEGGEENDKSSNND